MNSIYSIVKQRVAARNEGMKPDESDERPYIFPKQVAAVSA